MRTSAKDGPHADAGAGPDADDEAVNLVTRRPDPALTKLEEGYNKVIDLIDAIKRHQQGQAERATEVTEALTRMSATLERIDGGGQQQSEHLAAIAEEIRIAGRHAAKWEEALCEFPRMAEAQREALGAVSRQMEDAGRRDKELTGSLASFREAVQTLGDTTTASTVALKDLQRASLEQQAQTAALIRAQSRRFTILLVVTLVLAAAGIIAALAGLARGG
ncbi:MAG: hypothetical protein H6816_13230 [Phycisphaerales bacterium]|nr:hypothetical protein [Phycisphaerales bacterium]